MPRNVYLDKKPLAEARRLFLQAFDWPALAGAEAVPTVEALGRVTEECIFAAYSSPAYHSAAMDGVALPASLSYGADDERPVRLKVGEEAFFVNTGQLLPEGCDAVVMIEEVHQPAPELVELRAAAFPWQHVRRIGEDIVTAEMLFPHHHRLGAADLAACLQAGVFEVRVMARPRVAIIPTGHELLDWRRARERPPRPGEIIESNSLFLAGLVREAGGVPTVWPLQPDDPAVIGQAVAEALAGDAHLVILNAGASAGSKDFSAAVLAGLGQVLVHGVTAMPGKPSILGMARGKPVVGSPGYAVSAWVCFDQFVAPALALMQGQEPPVRPRALVMPARPLPSKLGQEEFLRVHLGRVGANLVATPLKRGAGTITSLTRADGLLRIPENSEGLSQGERAEAELLVPPAAVERTLVVVGSHDVTLDLMADFMARRSPGTRVSSSHLGSLAGLVAIREGRCHLGGTHLLDLVTGEYNVSYLKRHLAGLPVKLVTLAGRTQGFMVKPGNPKGIAGLADLARPGVRMVNRQPGSGTRVLLDYLLRLAGIDPAAIQGYDHDEYTHMAVAIQVLAGGADVGVGVLSAARALGLGFIPLADERYDLCIPLAFWDDARVKVLREVLADPGFKQAVEALGGYDVSRMGEVVWES